MHRTHRSAGPRNLGAIYFEYSQYLSGCVQIRSANSASSPTGLSNLTGRHVLPMFRGNRRGRFRDSSAGISASNPLDLNENCRRRIARQGEDDQQVSGPGLRGPGLVRPCPRPSGQGRLGRSGQRFQDALGGRRQVPEAAERHRPRREGRRRPDPRNRPGSRRRGDLLARAGGAQGEERAEEADGRARRVQRHHQAGGVARR